MTDPVVARLRIALAEHAAGEPRRDAVVLGVHHDERTAAARDRHHVEDLPVVDVQALVGHVDLERADALFDRGGQVDVEGLLVRVGDDQVQGVIDDRFLSRTFAVIGQHRRERVAAMLGAERDDGGRAAERRGHRSGIEIVGAQDAERRALLEMAMAVDAAREHELSARIDFARAAREIGPSAAMRPPFTPTSLSKVFGIGRDGAAADDEVEIAHSIFTPASLLTTMVDTLVTSNV